ncbi:MAG: orotate phosphoribosyltransferase [Candidatus Nanoarchaeia archaeon]|nr:orotate phosphoribosyltransferase [Candidatus Nanoarchaeia archaeon]
MKCDICNNMKSKKVFKCSKCGSKFCLNCGDKQKEVCALCQQK